MVTLVVRDANGNQELGGGLAESFVLGNGKAGGTFSAVTDNGNGTYTATFTATTAGTNTIVAAIGGQAVTSTPPTVTVTPAASSVAAHDVAMMAVLADADDAGLKKRLSASDLG
jgi:adhesin/invasin